MQPAPDFFSITKKTLIVSKNNIPSDLEAIAIAEAKSLNLSQIYVTSDKHLYSPANKNDLEYHSRTNDVSYWLVTIPQEEKEEKVVKEDTEEKDELIDKKEGNEQEVQLSDEQQKLLETIAGETGNALDEDLKKLVGVPAEKLEKQTKDALIGVAGKLNITVADTDTKSVIAAKIVDALNPAK